MVYQGSRRRLLFPRSSLDAFLLKTAGALTLLAFVHAQTTDQSNDLHCLQYFVSGATVINTTGTDNVPGTTRSGDFADRPYHETLIAFAGYLETLRFESICSSRTTYIDVITYICSAGKIAGYDLWYTLHQSVFPALVAQAGATAYGPFLRGDAADIWTEESR
ncbi:hypothetical protein C8F04DRAFT_1272072 [Mycena alexandri]|uniref:Uncharacterized protein n=1 Tax=Mycena alexandri TaxID=1745969 RepID=A0AAD6S7Y2_9AGAR|nr:hypothetical protein C8F04DRAFT_1272072 [Mycena alexandri]